MAIPDVEDRVESAITRFENAGNITHDFANNPVGSYIQTESGLIPSLGEWLSIQESKVDQITGLPERVTAVESAIAGKASSGSNSDITSINGLTSALSVSQGGTGMLAPADDAYSGSINVVGINKARALNFSVVKRFALHGYYVDGDCLSFYRYDPADTTTPDDGLTCLVGAGGRRAKLNHNGRVSTAQAGARDASFYSSFDSGPSIASWFSAVLTNGLEGIISPFRHASSDNILWDLASKPTNGFVIRGFGAGRSIIELAAGKTWALLGSANTASFYGSISDFNIRGNINGPVAKIGASELGDAVNVLTLKNMTFNNSNLGVNASSLDINSTYQLTGNIVANGGGSGRPESTAPRSMGCAVIIRQMQFSNLVIAAGNADKGIYFTAGYVLDNVFPAVDIEEVNYGIVGDTPNLQKNTFLNGTIVAINPFQVTAGMYNKMDNVSRSLYTGGVDKGAIKGLTFLEPGKYVATPAVPASGTAIKNNTGRAILINIRGGSVSSVSVAQAEGGTRGEPIGTYSGVTLALQPEDTITVTGTGYSWTWVALA